MKKLIKLLLLVRLIPTWWPAVWMHVRNGPLFRALSAAIWLVLCGEGGLCQFPPSLKHIFSMLLPDQMFLAPHIISNFKLLLEFQSPFRLCTNVSHSLPTPTLYTIPLLLGCCMGFYSPWHSFKLCSCHMNPCWWNLLLCYALHLPSRTVIATWVSRISGGLWG